MSNVNKVTLLSERTSGVPPVIFFQGGERLWWQGLRFFFLWHLRLLLAVTNILGCSAYILQSRVELWGTNMSNIFLPHLTHSKQSGHSSREVSSRILKFQEWGKSVCFPGKGWNWSDKVNSAQVGDETRWNNAAVHRQLPCFLSHFHIGGTGSLWVGRGLNIPTRPPPRPPS